MPGRQHDILNIKNVVGVILDRSLRAAAHHEEKAIQERMNVRLFLNLFFVSAIDGGSLERAACRNDYIDDSICIGG